MSDTIKIKPSFDLFEANRKLRSRMQQAAGIVQNNVDVSPEQVLQAKNEFIQLRADIDQWWKDVANHIKKCNE